MNYLIIANGPFFPEDLIRKAVAKSDCVVALDGAADKLALMGLKPNVILGDFDSIQSSSDWGIDQTLQDNIAKLGKKNTWLVLTLDQNLTDLKKAIRFCDHPVVEENQAEGFKVLKPASSIHILCGVDGRPDHHIGNVRALRSEYLPERALYLYSRSHTLFYVKDREVEIHRNPDLSKAETQYCAVIAMPKAAFVSKGLKWDGKAQTQEDEHAGPDGYKLYPGHDSTCNELLSDTATIQILGEAIVMAPKLT